MINRNLMLVCVLTVGFFSNGLTAVETPQSGILSQDKNQANEKTGARALSFAERIKEKEARALAFSRDVSDDEDDGWMAKVACASCPTEETASEEGEEVTATLLDKEANAFPLPYDYFAYAGYAHYLHYFSDDGRVVQIEDGGQWEIAAQDVNVSRNWLTGDRIGFYPNHDWFSVYDYRIVNFNTGNSVKANIGVIGPIVGGPYTNYLVTKDSYYRTVYLTDGSVWEVSHYDTSKLARWLPGDVIVIGLNDSWWTQTSWPAMLINLSTCEYILANRR